MDEKTKLLEQLRIDRSTGTRSAPKARGSAPIWVVYTLILVIIAGVGSWFLLRPHAAGGTTASSSAVESANSSGGLDVSNSPAPVPAGQSGFARTGIGTIVAMDSLEVEGDVSENFINRVRVGQLTTVRLNAYPDWSIPGSVKAIIPTADRSKATVKVRVGFKQKDPRILPEMGARVSFLNEAPAAVTS